MFGAVSDGEGAYFDVSGEGGLFFEGKAPSAVNIAGDEAVEVAFVGVDGFAEFDFGSSFDAESVAGDFCGNFGVFAEC